MSETEIIRLRVAIKDAIASSGTKPFKRKLLTHRSEGRGFYAEICESDELKFTRQELEARIVVAWYLLAEDFFNVEFRNLPWTITAEMIACVATEVKRQQSPPQSAAPKLGVSKPRTPKPARIEDLVVAFALGWKGGIPRSQDANDDSQPFYQAWYQRAWNLVHLEIQNGLDRCEEGLKLYVTGFEEWANSASMSLRAIASHEHDNRLWTEEFADYLVNKASCRCDHWLNQAKRHDDWDDGKGGDFGPKASEQNVETWRREMTACFKSHNLQSWNPSRALLRDFATWATSGYWRYDDDLGGTSFRRGVFAQAMVARRLRAEGRMLTPKIVLRQVRVAIWFCPKCQQGRTVEGCKDEDCPLKRGLGQRRFERDYFLVLNDKSKGYWQRKKFWRCRSDECRERLTEELLGKVGRMTFDNKAERRKAKSRAIAEAEEGQLFEDQSNPDESELDGTQECPFCKKALKEKDAQKSDTRIRPSFYWVLTREGSQASSAGIRGTQSKGPRHEEEEIAGDDLESDQAQGGNDSPDESDVAAQLGTAPLDDYTEDEPPEAPDGVVDIGLSEAEDASLTNQDHFIRAEFYSIFMRHLEQEDSRLLKTICVEQGKASLKTVEECRALPAAERQRAREGVQRMIAFAEEFLQLFKEVFYEEKWIRPKDRPRVEKWVEERLAEVRAKFKS